MKHVFIVNSHTTFLSAIGAIEIEKLTSMDVILVGIRKYKNSIVKHPFKMIDLSELSEECFQDFLHSYLARKKVIRKIDDFIEGYIKDKFVLYSPHFALPMAQVMYSHELCERGAYIQEGAFTYKGLFLTNPSLIQKIRYFYAFYLYKRTTRIRGGRQWYIEGHLMKQKEIKSYALSDSFFKFLPSNNIIVKWPQVDINIVFEADSRIFVFDGFIKNGFMEKNIYMNICERLIKMYNKKYNYIKFHPGQTEDEKDALISFFRDNKLHYEVMSNDIPMELIISSMKNLNFAGFSSSVLYYALDYGHHVIQREDWQLESPMYSNYKKKMGVTTLD